MLTVKEAADRARVSPSLVCVLLGKRKLKAMRIGCRDRGSRRIEVLVLEQSFQNCESEPPPE